MDDPRVKAALELTEAVRDWAVAAYQWEGFWEDMNWRPEGQAENNGMKLRDFIKEAEMIFPELAERGGGNG